MSQNALVRRSKRAVFGLAAVITASASPLAAQFVGPVRTFAGSYGCATGALAYRWPNGTSSPVTTRGIAFCATPQVTIGRSATTNDIIARLRPGFVVFEPDLVVTPLLETFPWTGIAGPSGFFGPGGGNTSNTPITAFSSIDFWLASPTQERSVDSFSFTSFFARADWLVPGNLGFPHPAADMTANGFVSVPLVETTLTPEPSTWALMATGLLAVGGVATRRKRVP